jgi:hypothetical protein
MVPASLGLGRASWRKGLLSWGLRGAGTLGRGNRNGKGPEAFGKRVRRLVGIRQLGILWTMVRTWIFFIDVHWRATEGYSVRERIYVIGLFFGSAGDGTQCLTTARQALYHIVLFLTSPWVAPKAAMLGAAGEAMRRVGEV